MKTFTSLVAMLLLLTNLRGENIPLQTVQRTGTYTTKKNEVEDRKVKFAKCNAKKRIAAGQASAFAEYTITGDFQTEAAADAALATKISGLLGTMDYEKTITEYDYTGWSPNGSSVAVKSGEDSKDDYAKWKQENASATEVTAEPAPPCDEINPAADPAQDGWAEQTLSRTRTVTKEYKFSYKISFKQSSS
jgi:hypothetical protein